MHLISLDEYSKKMENKVPQPPPTTRTSPKPPTTNREGSTRSKPPQMQHDSTMRRAIADGAERARTYSANSTHDTNPTVTRSSSHYRSANNVRFREPSLDPLLMASLDRPDLEDEAETTLIDILERRQATFDTDYFNARIAHRRNRTYGGAFSDINSFQSPDVENMKPYLSQYSTGVSRRPGLVPHSTSYRSRRNNMGDQSYNNIEESLEVEGNGVNLCSNENSASFKSDSTEGAVPQPNSADGIQANSSSLRKQHKYINWNMRRRPTSFNKRRVSSEATDYSDTSSIRERAFQVAMKKHDSMKIFISSDVDEDLSNLLNKVEAVRENDESLRGSVSRNTGRSRECEDNINDNWSRSTISFERDISNDGSSEYSTGKRGHVHELSHQKSNHQMFMGISTPLGGGRRESNVDMLFQVAEKVQDLCQIPEEDEEEDIPKSSDSVRSHSGSISSQLLASENAIFLQQIRDFHPDIPESLDEMDETRDLDARETNEKTPMLSKTQYRKTLGMKVTAVQKDHNIGSGKLRTVKLWISVLCKHFKTLWLAFDFDYVREKMWNFFQYQLACIIIPMLAMATFSFYRLGNPTLPFLPNETSVSWWILFTIRSYLTLHLAYVTQYLFVDVFATRSPMGVHMVGPLVTLYIMNAKGWPFLLTCWGIWNFVLVHGDKDFNEHWFHSTDIEMLNPANVADGIADSDLYTDILLSMILVGVATSVKRTILALYLGKRVYIHYKPKLEKIMIDMLILTEVAELANALKEFEGEQIDSLRTLDSHHSCSQLPSHPNKNTMVEFVKGHDKNDNHTSDDDRENVANQERIEPIKSWNRLRSMSDSDLEDNNSNVSNTADRVLASTKQLSVESDLAIKESDDADNQTDSSSKQKAFDAALNSKHGYKDSEADRYNMTYSAPPIDTVDEPLRNAIHEASTTSQIKSHLDRWEEPPNKLVKGADPTIHEILQFRKALSFLEEEHPFGLSFGPASNRNSCINSSRSLYRRLLHFDATSPVLHFDVIGVLAYDADGNFDEKKAKSLVRLFRPDKFDKVTLLAFVQSCDGVYKSIRYLRASVDNSTSIDRVLESIFNTIFNFFLFLAVLSVLKLNPWALLVSMSTVLVSFAFALGPTAAKFIEGMVMIAVRRPFDLGDKISISNPNDKSGDSDPGYDDMWLVEDCNLFTATLRLTKTNEISYLNNGMLSNCKIVNHGRSVGALVNLLIPIQLEATHEQIQIVRSSLDQYIRDNPRIWSCLVFWRTSAVDPNMSLISYSLRVQHVKSWQDHTSIMRDRGDLLKFCFEILMRLGIEYNTPASLRDIFVKELPQHSSYVLDTLITHDESK